MLESRHSVPSGRSRLRGAAVPAALVGVSVLLVLIVVMVSSLMGGGEGDRILVAGPSPAGSEQGQVLDGQTAGAQPSPAVETVASRPASLRPSVTVGAARGTPAPAAPAFPPLSVEAESATLSPAGGSESAYPCATCSGGSKVRFVGKGRTVTFGGLSVPAAATYHLTIAYELDGTRSFFVSANGGASTQVSCTGTDWANPATVTVAVVLKAGTNSITFGNPSADAPDLDRITVGP